MDGSLSGVRCRASHGAEHIQSGGRGLDKFNIIFNSRRIIKNVEPVDQVGKPISTMPLSVIGTFRGSW